jgi:hypothetical protein
LIKAIEHPPQGNGDNPQVVAYQDPHVSFQNWDRGDEKNKLFFLSLLMNDYLLHNCMLESSNVMTKKVME